MGSRRNASSAAARRQMTGVPALDVFGVWSAGLFAVEEIAKPVKECAAKGEQAVQQAVQQQDAKSLPL
jgi:hypothetical protein